MKLIRGKTSRALRTHAKFAGHFIEDKNVFDD